MDQIVTDPRLDAPALAPPPDVSQVFFAFLQMTLSGWGGVLPWARWVLVEKRRWLSEQEFAEMLGMCQVIPGPNIMNLGVLVGVRFAGGMGAVAAVAGLVLAPFCLVLVAGLFYARGRVFPVVDAAIDGTAAAAAGLVIGSGLAMARRLRPNAFAIALALAAFVGSGLLRQPLLAVVAVVAPLGLLLAWRGRL